MDGTILHGVLTRVICLENGCKSIWVRIIAVIKQASGSVIIVNFRTFADNDNLMLSTNLAIKPTA